MDPYMKYLLYSVNLVILLYLFGQKGLLRRLHYSILIGTIIMLFIFALLGLKSMYFYLFICFFLLFLYFSQSVLSSWSIPSFFILNMFFCFTIMWLITFEIPRIFYSQLLDILGFNIFTLFYTLIQSLILVVLKLLLDKIETKINYRRIITYSSIKNKSLSLLMMLFIIGTVFLHNQFSQENNSLWIIILELLFFCFSICILYLTYVVYEVQELKNELEIESRKHLEEKKQFNELSAFKHDFNSLIIALEFCLESKSYSEAEYIINQLIVQSKSINDHDKFKKIDMIRSNAIQGLLIDFMYKCQKADINVDIDVKMISSENISYIEYSVKLVNTIRCLSILLNNAYEETKETSSSTITITFIENKQSLIFRISNPIRELVDENRLYSLGYTKKDKHSGIGMHTLKNIENADPHIRVLIRQKEHLFLATLVINIE